MMCNPLQRDTAEKGESFVSFCQTKSDRVNKWTQDLIHTQSEPHQAPNTKAKDRQIQLSSHKMNRWQAELATLSQKGENSVIQT